MDDRVRAARRRLNPCLKDAIRAPLTQLPAKWADCMRVILAAPELRDDDDAPVILDFARRLRASRYSTAEVRQLAAAVELMLTAPGPIPAV